MEGKPLVPAHSQAGAPQEALSAQKLREYLNIAGVAPKLSEKERMNFIEIAQAYSLNPFKREIYCVSYGVGENRTTSIITGYEVYIKRAERTGKLDGWEVAVEGKMPELKAVVTIYRNDWSRAFKHEVYFEEVVQRRRDGQMNAMWAKMPKFMLRKVAIAQGFRLCFPDELGGMPYTADEITEGVVVPTVTATPVKEEPELTQAEKEQIAQAVSKEELIEICAQLQQTKGRLYRPAIVKYYNQRLAVLQEEAAEKRETK